MRKYIFICALAAFILGKHFLSAFAESIPRMEVTKYAKPDEQQTAMDHDKQDQDKEKGKIIAPYHKKESSSPNGPFTTSHGSFTTNLNDPKKQKPYFTKDLNDSCWNHKDHFDHHSTNNYGYINVQNVFIPAVIIPADFMSLSYAGETYYYNQGTFYQLKDQVLAPVKTPIGAIVDQIPADYSTITLEREVYYIYRDIYYKKVSSGYEVVSRPAVLEN